MHSDMRQDIHALDLKAGWEQVPQSPAGLMQKMLSNWLDEDAKEGCRTRLIHFPPGQRVDARFVHDYWEEVYMLEGELTIAVGDDGVEMGTFGPSSYACRPPGTPHGPFRSDGGCIFLEVQYYSGPGGGRPARSAAA